MPTYQVEYGSDVGHVTSDENFYSWNSSHSFGRNSSSVSLHAFLRFYNVTIPSGVIITSAQVVFTGAANNDGDECNVVIYGNDVDNAGAIEDYADFDGLALTTASVSWGPVGAWEWDSVEQTADIKTIVQEIVDRAGWSSGNYLTLVLYGDTSVVEDGGNLPVRSFEGEGEGNVLPYLEVTYEDPALNVAVGLSSSSPWWGYWPAPPEGSVIASGSAAVSPPGFGLRVGMTAKSTYWGYRLNPDMPLVVAGEAVVHEPIRINRVTALRRYHCTITGAADGLSDVAVPITTLQVRKRDDGQSYCQVTIPGEDRAADIYARANGDIAVHVGYVQAGVELLRELLLRVAMDSVRVDQGPLSTTISLSGYTTIGDGVAKTVPVSGVIYIASYADGRQMWRSAVVNPDIVPGDTVTYDGASFVAGTITYTINARTQTMEITEAEA